MNAAKPLLGCTSMVYWKKRVSEAVRLVANAGFDTIEIWADHLLRTEETPEEIRRSLDESGLRCTVHCPIIDVNICSMNRVIAETSLELYLRSARIAGELRALLFVFHAGNLFSRFDPLPEYWDKLLQALLSVLETGNGDLLVVAENMETDKPEEVVKSGEDLNRVLGAFTSRDTGVCWDLTHLLNTKNNLHFLETVTRIDHVHLSDCLYNENDPSRKHLRLGEGNLDLSQLLAHPFARQARVVSLETVMIDPEPDDLVSELTEMKRLLGSTGDE
jgi:sugar phosphate isomerase/epimerase